MPPDIPAQPAHPVQSVGWLELFYDLVFVAAVVTFSDAISFRPDLARIGAVDGAFATTWLIWLATTLHANRYRDDGAVQRFLVLVQMLLLTVNALAVGDGFDAHPALISVTYALLALDVAVMYARVAHGRDEQGQLARVRRNQYSIAAVPIIAAAFVPEPVRVLFWIAGFALLAWPTLGFRYGRLGVVPPFDEHHFVERLGLLTILVCGESFVKVSLLAADGTLDGIDLSALITMFGFVFGVWWAYFDDVPRAGVRPEPGRTVVWLVGHLLLQIGLVAGAVGYAKVLGYQLGATLVGDKSLLVTLPLVAVLVGLTLVGLGSRRVPQRPFVKLRLGVVVVAGAMAVVTWQLKWISAAAAAAILACIALAAAAAQSFLLRRSTVEPLPESVGRAGPA